ncbi:MAG: hypothetical protein A2887_01890 [Alphaproteobacteria bacterium RIFCSPLOWO2_01_FULL_40_26]|nr:MAG: hypothetical protein A3D15_01255 [Alphaproteobacteria bacterium RIFCSPHIGHO2_02_FULL_40_34]OFW93945.1 MAG: hypothetical protein A2887_01890 [Alphaproteobacteria bacterium RIFCSPLOWO2_01_FULL_40_26]OFX09657.1 MAG: hypothetical protein A3H30_03245 [Alphaproteobacteria bacterium RIFCSPLOWO2_02_FULL_40_19]OFX11986.1 MAG: hypothetical protein A3G22_00695 [Alphaproteobacteria bacterium RIFCSPLOWO2_12_FULL_40_11]
MSIFNTTIFNPTKSNEKYASSFRRSTAASIDISIVLFLRIIAMQILGAIWMNNAIIEFIQEFREKFGTETMKNTPEHIDFVVHHRVFVYALTFYFLIIMVGAIYHAYLNSSSWMGTIGKRIMKITIITNNNLKIGLKRGLLHYFLSILPFAFILFLTSFQFKNELTFYQAVTYSETMIFFGILFLLWIQIHLFTKNKTTAYDLICNTVLVNGKTEAKWPWSKTDKQC